MEDLITRLRKRAEIRRNIPSRKSVQEGKPDRLADLLEEAAEAIEQLLKRRPLFKFDNTSKVMLGDGDSKECIIPITRSWRDEFGCLHIKV